MRILIIPDIHGRDFWREPCSHIDEFDKVIFLGDYHDPYNWQVSYEESRENLQHYLLPFLEQHQDKCICLLGNHDANYVIYPQASRMDNMHYFSIKKWLKQMHLRPVYIIGKYIFSHSGVLPQWLEQNGLTYDILDKIKIRNKAITQVSPYRGGRFTKCGSCIWGDIEEFRELYDENPNYYQIFGHSQMNSPFITDTWACLDCRKAFTLDTETGELKEFEA